MGKVLRTCLVKLGLRIKDATKSAAIAVVGVDSVEEGFFSDRVDQFDLCVKNENGHDLRLDTVSMSYRSVALHKCLVERDGNNNSTVLLYFF